MCQFKPKIFIPQRYIDVAVSGDRVLGRSTYSLNNGHGITTYSLYDREIGRTSPFPFDKGVYSMGRRAGTLQNWGGGFTLDTLK